MVSLWPFKGEDTTASFEKTLSTLSTKIKKANVTQDSFRARSRRYKVIWTLYTSLAYLLSALILVFITGWQSWGSVEYSVISGGPVVIYLVRTTLATYYDYRMSNNQLYLDDLNKQREAAITKFKAATKYDSTQQLLEKYGAAPKQPAMPKESPASAKRRTTGSADKPFPQRTGLPPPPTANIRRLAGDSFSGSITPQQQQQFQNNDPISNRNTPVRAKTAYSALHDTSSASSPQTSASFAPNAYFTVETAHQYAQPQWYDRIMDLLLGEDETRATNRMALICQHCKLVNGQAPPGVKRLEDVGKWRCNECKGWNGVESEVTKLIEDAKSNPSEDFGEPGPAVVDGEVEDSKDLPKDEMHDENKEPEAVDEESDVEMVEAEDAETDPPARLTRSRVKDAKQNT